MAGIVIATTVLLMAANHAAMCNAATQAGVVSPDPRDFFPNVRGNLTKIVWAHAVNSRAELDAALSSDDIMMLEADVVMGKLNDTGNATDIPIMAHPPATVSDLSLDEFISSNVQNNRTKGIKLDFKSIEAFNGSKPILAKWRPNMKFPVFINADILSGPVNATDTPVKADDFLKGAAEIIPECTLSVGWTTRYGKKFNITEGRYTTEQFQTMINTLAENRVAQSVTYPVRAGLASNDIEVVKALLKNTTSSNATLTIWSSEDDSVNIPELSKLIQDVGIDRIYVDVPKDLKSKLDLSAASAMVSTIMMTLSMTLAALALPRIQ